MTGTMSKVTVVASGIVLQTNKNHAKPPRVNPCLLFQVRVGCAHLTFSHQTAEGRAGVWEALVSGGGAAFLPCPQSLICTGDVTA